MRYALRRGRPSWATAFSPPETGFIPSTATVYACAVSGGAPSEQWMSVELTWTAVTGATSYTVQVGTATTLSDYDTIVVGNVLTYTLTLPPGTYYIRVVDNFTNTASAEQVVYV